MTRLYAAAAALATVIAAASLGAAYGSSIVDTIDVPGPTITATETVTTPGPERTVYVTRASRQVSQRPKFDNKGGSKYHNDVWARIAQCESGGRLHAESPSGLYLGLYQLHRGFYITHGYRGDSWKSLTAAQQLDIARYVQARQGWKAWPTCGKKAGVL